MKIFYYSCFDDKYILRKGYLIASSVEEAYQIVENYYKQDKKKICIREKDLVEINNY